MSDLLKGKVVVVTGAASGIGRAIAIAAAQHCAKAVIVADIIETPREGGGRTTAEIEALGVPARFIRTDVTRRSEVDALVESAAQFGGVDVMVCNAGIALPSDGGDVPEDDYRRLMAVNLDGVLFGAQAAARQMKARSKSGSIVLMASMGGISGTSVTVAYSTSKGGVVLMAKALADSLGPDGVRVNSVCPGMIDTEMVRTTPKIAAAAEEFRKRTPLRRTGKPSDIADAVVWLGSDMSSYVTGIALLVDGGLLAVI